MAKKCLQNVKNDFNRLSWYRDRSKGKVYSLHINKVISQISYQRVGFFVAKSALSASKIIPIHT